MAGSSMPSAAATATDGESAVALAAGSPDRRFTSASEQTVATPRATATRELGAARRPNRRRAACRGVVGVTSSSVWTDSSRGCAVWVFRGATGGVSPFLPQPPTELADGFGPEVALPARREARRIHPRGTMGPRSAATSAARSSAVSIGVLMFEERGPADRSRKYYGVARHARGTCQTVRRATVRKRQDRLRKRTPSFVLGAVAEVGREPLLRLGDGPALPPGVV